MGNQMEQEAIKVFVGCDPNNCDLEQMMVLDYSIRKHTKHDVEIVWMQLSHDENSAWFSNPKQQQGWHTEKWATPFSGFRWAIPEYCGFKGRAIYMDADVLVLCDLAELWNHPMAAGTMVVGKGGGQVARLCTCVWDCQEAKNHLPPLAQMKQDPDAHQKMMQVLQKNPQWVHYYQDTYNCVDGEGLDIKQIKILHYSDMGTQFSHAYSLPRLRDAGMSHWFDGDILPHPRQDLSALFDEYYQAAVDAGYRPENYAVRPFGVFPKASQVGYTGNGVTRQQQEEGSSKSWLSRSWKKMKSGLKGSKDDFSLDR